MSNASDPDLDRILKVIYELRRAAEPDPCHGPASAEGHGFGSGTEEEIEQGLRHEPVGRIPCSATEFEEEIKRYGMRGSLEPTLVPETYGWAPRPRAWIGIMMRFAGAAAVAAVSVAFVAGKLPTSLNVATSEQLEERPSLAFSLSEPSKSDDFDRPLIASEPSAPAASELTVGEESPERRGERAPVSALPRVAIAADATSERRQSATAHEAPPQVTETMAPGLITRQLDRDEVAALLTRGDAFITSGDLASARLVLQRAAEAGDAHAALALAGTFDPNLLAKLGQGLVADVAMARFWYERAKQFGSPEAPRRLEQLASKVNLGPLETKVVTNETPPAAPAKTDVPGGASGSSMAVTPKPSAQTPSQPKCDVSACNSIYVSFRESDCTYQPRNGPRRLCTRQK